MSDIREYFDSRRGKRIAVIGMGVSNTPLIRMLLRADLDVTVCDRAQRERVEERSLIPISEPTRRTPTS